MRRIRRRFLEGLIVMAAIVLGVIAWIVFPPALAPTLRESPEAQRAKIFRQVVENLQAAAREADKK